MSPYLEQLLRSSGKEVPKSKRILELNPEHAIVKSLQGLFDKNPDDSRIERTARLL
jgi:molecular chaperone HtpG